MSNTLLPCPFCGGEQAIIARYIGYGSLGLGSHDEYRVVCKECCASSDEYKSEAKAIAAWNRRAGKDINVATNADRIRGMNDEELAREMLFFVPSDFNRHYTGIAGGYYATADEAIQANFDWLQQSAKEE